MKKWAIEYIGDDGFDKCNIIQAGNCKEAQDICDDLGVELVGEVTYDESNPIQPSREPFEGEIISERDLIQRV